jgi:catechol 2,3-dioxygenase-like lactoylglutathione lyase family enzyme
MSPAPAAPQILAGPVRQTGYVVRDLDRSIASWLTLGVGPWLTIRTMLQRGGRYRGAPSEPVLSIAFANSGELQLELIQQHNAAPSAYREFLDAGREGFHHLAFWTEDFDARSAQAAAAGWSELQSGDGNGAARFAYFDAGGSTSTAIELMELNDVTRWLAATVRAAASEWDGAEPIRPLF